MLRDINIAVDADISFSIFSPLSWICRFRLSGWPLSPDTFFFFRFRQFHADS